MKNEKNYMGFLIHKIKQILKRFAGTFCWAQTSYLWRVKDDKWKGSLYGSVPSKSSKLLLVLEPPNNWGSFVSHVEAAEAGGISVVLLGSWPLRSLRSLCGMGPKGASEKNRLSDTRPNYFLPSHYDYYYYYCTGKKKRMEPLPTNYTLSSSTHHGLRMEKIVQ